MKIITIVRVRNEQDNISRFISSYKNIADEVLIADGGSSDKTIEAAEKFIPFAKVRTFDDQEHIDKTKEWRNHQGKHINFLIDWAEKEKADWIIFDDCDCVPNKFLKEHGRILIKSCTKNALSVSRIYMYKQKHYFETLSKPAFDDFTPSLWAWKANQGYRALETDPLTHDFNFDIWKESQEIQIPYALLHHFYEDDDKMEKKLELRRKTGEPHARNPKLFGGKILPIEEWMAG